MPHHIAMLLSNAFRPDPRVLKEANSLAALGYRVSIICWDRAAKMKPEETLQSGVRILRVQNILATYGTGARQLLPLLRFWQAAVAVLDQLHPDAVHCHDFDTLPPGLWWGKRHRRPVIYDAHEYYAELARPRLKGAGGWLLYHMIRAVERVGARLVSAIVTVDETLGAIYRHLNRRVVIVGHYPNRALASTVAAVFTRDQLTLVYIGRLSSDRGLFMYLDLIRHLRQQGVPARLRLVGAFTSPKEEKNFRHRCQDLNSAVDIINWLPYDQVPALLREADVGLAVLQPEPYYVAAVPVKLFEYMAAGLPVMASHFPLIAAILNEAHCGALIDPADTQSAVTHLRYWWEHPEAARLAGENGRQSILQKYNWEILVQRLDELYSRLLGNRPS